ncbi:hypothetical protein CC1G_06127 [Coprinopsis cinerea okayama7|uniref:CHAT domain-containing protein n=1 Tax=Coprinopsis cinerea (strain Okayama-7 / 130 / ATCC MYA-4618 / FGSC 9003) TaxID=240176 RepID=A8PA95_COPC7|nr:hypothetical protein CC1G_06127 [Coprinopsis cinerea okayama7\|eukprot:XP_001839937.2 hypothetical protein CC1G_06127 [Coprinopsis cinerea okayama7\
MDTSTNAPPSADCTSVVDEPESSIGNTQAELEDELEGALSRVNELLDEATKEMKDDVLASAIVELQEIVFDEEDDAAHVEAEVGLVKVLLTRFTRYGWVDDLDEVMAILLRETLNPFAFMDQQPISGSEDQTFPDNVSSTLHSLREYRQSIDMCKLEDALVVASGVLGPSCRGSTNSRGQLLLRVGSALVLKYLATGEKRDLNLAEASFQDARRVLGSGPALFTALLNLQLVTSIKLVECKGEESTGLLLELEQLREEMEGEDEQGSNAYMLGSELMEGDNLQIDESILRFRQSLSFRPSPHPRRLEALDHCAIAHRNRFRYTGDLCDLEESVALDREALALRPPGHPDRPFSLNNVATSLLTLFQHKGNFSDLDESISLHREALDHHPPDRPISLNHLASSLAIRFQLKGDFRDLEEYIALFREALALRSPDHPDRPISLNQLANSFLTRFEHKGDFRDLEQSVTLLREALSPTYADHRERPQSLNTLAGSLLTRFLHKSDFHDLEESVTLYREVLDLRPPGHPDRPRLLNELATSLGTRFRHKGDVSDLEESVTLLRKALDLRPPNHPDRPRLLNDLAASLGARFEHKGDLQDLEESISCLRNTLLLLSQTDGFELNSSETLAAHPYWLTVTGNLVHKLKLKYQASRDSAILDEIFQLLRSGTGSRASSPLVKMRHAVNWSTTCREFVRLESALEAYSYGVAILPQLASLDLTLEQRQNALVHASDLSRDAVQCAIERGQLDTAVIFLSTARSVFWSQALQFRGSLDRLDALHPELAAELRSVTRQLEIATHESEHPLSHSTLDKGLSTRPYLLAQKREAVIARIREINGFHDFLLPPSFDTLKTAATDNPIVFLNASKYGCHILILTQDILHCHPLATDLEQITVFTNAVRRLSGGQAVGQQLQRKIDNYCESRNTRLKLRRKSGRSADDDFKQLLEILWVVVAEPVIRILGLQKTDNPKRIWWCPTGPFAFLPIHAAGIYSDSAEASDCLSDYVVSSYCSSPQDLIAPPPTPNPEYEVLVVVEPGDSGPRIHRLPFTMEELKRIQGLVPHERHLVARVGSADTPSTPDAILNHINTASIVHFGCHGTQDSSNPLDSSLILSGGRLTMGSLIRGCRTSNASLAYLSACETAMGDEERPDESLSLAAAMQFAGFRSVVATMWSIHDEDAPIVADTFYRYLFRRGRENPPDITDAAYGLHLAVKKLRDLGRPFHQWVPFVHHGI